MDYGASGGRYHPSSSSGGGYGYGGGGSTSGGGGGNVAHTLMTLEQKIEAMEKDVKQRLQAVTAAEREGAALKEELAQCRELRQALLKRWHEARIAYDEVQLQLLETQGRVAAASKGIKDAQRLHAQLLPPARPHSSEGDAAAGTGGSAMEELKRGHALVLGAEMPSRVLRRFNAKLEAEVGGMRRRQEEKKAALQALFEKSLRGEGEAEEMVQIHNEMVACRGAIAKQRAAKAAAQAEVEAKRRELEELKTKSADMARRLQEEETAYMSLHNPTTPAAGPLPLPLPPLSSSSFSSAAATNATDVDADGGFAYGCGYGYGDDGLSLGGGGYA